MYYDVVRAIYEYDARIDSYLLCGGFSTREEAMQYINAHDFTEAYDGRTYKCVEIEKHNANGDIVSIIDIAVYEFKIGDRVKAIREVEGNSEIIDIIGTIVSISTSGNCRTYGVEFDKPINGHTCRGKCRDEHGWFVDEKDIVPAFDDVSCDGKEFEESEEIFSFLGEYKVVGA